MPTRKPAAVFIPVMLLTGLLYLLDAPPVVRAGTLPAETRYKEDVNRDGNVNVTDVIALLLLQRNDPGNPDGDYDGNGKEDIADAIALLLAIRDGRLTPVQEQLPDPGDTTTIYGITMVSVPGGTFQMGCDTTEPDERPVHTVTVDPFLMSVFEITNVQYAAYLNEALAGGEITADADSVKGVSGLFRGKTYMEFYESDDLKNSCWISYDGSSFEVQPGKERWPVVWVTWYGAYAFAEHYGLGLPTEAQCEYASRGGRQYEFGTISGRINTEIANYGQVIGSARVVGSYAPNPFRLRDLAGNVSEWCYDYYDSEYYSKSPELNPAGPNFGAARVTRGGGWNNCDFSLRSSNRTFQKPYYKISYIGFRVVRR
ncbi:MAG: SUMF1/EgtB/PvdO family nonheme iron enzyme [Candidatus Glassbacteria bacterium]|nr:SUMF1/EgtB/PvdO family nonheme iron enzyme [Candidatus Glassbacteria bacterium]